jgi:superfamily II DNA/RNA helicase
MFDPATAQFIRSAPALPGLDPIDLVDELTSAYVEIASARLAVGQTETAQAVNLAALVDRMSRLADTYEGQIILELNPARSKAAAFVAGSARQVITQIVRLGDAKDAPSRLDEDVVGADIAAALLFLIAERTSDAFEAARDIRAAGEPNAVRRALILSLGRFARGQFVEIAATDVDRERLGNEDDYGYAADLLFRELLRGLILMAQAGLGIVGLEAIEAAQSLFIQVRALAIDLAVSDGTSPYSELRAISVYAGPHHLAALLMRASHDLRQGLLVHTLAPGGANQEIWARWLRGEATRWPYLWENHRAAIATGYLNQGSSLVMTSPTGSGNTTLAALKIAATLAAGKTVLYLAPTHALVSQVERDLNERIVGLATAEGIEDVTLDEIVQKLPDLAVVTPEQCFALLTFAPDLFGNVGLFVFDECHLMGISKPVTASSPARVDRRGIDAMLCVLTFMNVNVNADYVLLSAMISNGAEIAAWLKKVLDRPVFSFDDKWKPTRQLRGCIVYDKVDLATLTRSLTSSMPPIPLSAKPYGMFSLISGWHPEAPDKLAIRPFAAEPTALKKGGGNWLTANRYEVAAAIAAPFATLGLKVVIFCESIPRCVSTANSLNTGRPPLASRLDDDQTSRRDALISEVGAASAIYDAGVTWAAVHHGEMLSDERWLVESLFRNRESGLNVLAATSTLAQGLNLPCEVVILAGTDRLDDSDPEEKTRTSLMPHEILNAMGRAGRAGYAATGLAVAIPGKPVACNLHTKSVSDDGDMSVVFSEGDQCLPLADPLTTLFDQIEVSGVTGGEAQYLLRRLAISLSPAREGVETFEKLARRSLGFHQRYSTNPAAADLWVQSRKETLTAVLQGTAKTDALPWHEELAAKTGATSSFIASLATAYAHSPKHAVDASDWIDWLLVQLASATDDFDSFLRPETMIRIFGRAYLNQPTTEKRREIGLEGVKSALAPWLQGNALVEVEKAIAEFIAANEGVVKRPTRPDAKAKRARRFSIRLAPDLGFLCGVLNQIAQKIASDSGEIAPPMVGFLPQLIRRGFQTPYHYVISHDLPNPSRPAVQQIYESIASELDLLPGDDWTAISQKATQAQSSLLFSGVDPNFGSGSDVD